MWGFWDYIAILFVWFLFSLIVSAPSALYMHWKHIGILHSNTYDSFKRSYAKALLTWFILVPTLFFTLFFLLTLGLTVLKGVVSFFGTGKR